MRVVALFFIALVGIACGVAVEHGPAPKTPAPIPSPPEPHPTTAAPPPDPPISVAPFFANASDPRMATAARALEENHVAEARDLFAELAAAVDDPELTPRLRFLEGYLAFYAGDPQGAVAALPLLLHQIPALDPVIREVVARAYLALGDPDRSLSWSRGLEEEPTATWLQAEAMRARGDDAAPMYKQVFTTWPRSDLAAPARLAWVQTVADRVAHLPPCTPPDSDSEDRDTRETDAEPTTDTAAPVPDTEVPVPTDADTDATDGTAEESDQLDRSAMAALIRGVQEADSDKASDTTTGTDDTDRGAPPDADEATGEEAPPSGADTDGRGDPAATCDPDAAAALEMARTLTKGRGVSSAAAAEAARTLSAYLGIAETRTRPEPPLATTWFERALTDFDARKFERAMGRFATALRFARKDGELQCKARYYRARAAKNLRRHDEALVLFRQAAAQCTEPALRLRSLYNAAKEAMATDAPALAAELFAQVEREFPHHSYADDARLHRARALLALGDANRFYALVASIPTLYPEGDMRSEALWIGAKHALDTGNLERAETVLSQYFSAFPLESHWYRAGRSGYWLGRVRELRGDVDGAVQQYEYVITTAPFSFYMLCAYARLHALDPIRAGMLIGNLVPTTDRARFVPTASMLRAHPPLDTAVELLRLGLVSRAVKHIDAYLERATTPAAAHRIAAFVLREARQYNAAVRVATATDDWARHYPVGAYREAWEAAYPAAFPDEVAAASRATGTPAFVIWGIMREESRFSPTVESWANAHGLMQLIWPTARSMARLRNLSITQRSLRDPATNILLGAQYLAYLRDKVGAHPAARVAGYNAGEGAVRRWLRNGDVDLDRFVENIPYKQTRGYTKRVLSSAAVYRFLHGDHRDVWLIPWTVGLGTPSEP